jgi:predicted nucleotidyltransferase
MSKPALSRERVLTVIRDLLVKYHAQAAILFGSYARMEADDVSDIDLVVIGGGAFEPTDVFCLAEYLHRVTQKAVDVYELCEIDQQSDFYRTILREGVRIAA